MNESIYELQKIEENFNNLLEKRSEAFKIYLEKDDKESRDNYMKINEELRVLCHKLSVTKGGILF